jgi:hypothetical protein
MNLQEGFLIQFRSCPLLKLSYINLNFINILLCSHLPKYSETETEKEHWNTEKDLKLRGICTFSQFPQYIRFCSLKPLS